VEEENGLHFVAKNDVAFYMDEAQFFSLEMNI